MKHRVTAALVVMAAAAGGCADQYEPEEQDALTRFQGSALFETQMAVGVNDNSGGAPQGSPLVLLRFGGGSSAGDAVVARKMDGPPLIDGDPSEWQEIAGTVLPLQARGGPVGLTAEQWAAEFAAAYSSSPPFDFGIPTLTVKAGYDDRNVYFLMQWQDTVEHRRPEEWTFDGMKWTRSKSSEDRVVLAFGVGESFPGFKEVGCAAACHMKERLGDVSDAGKAYRFRMHTNAPGEIADVWAWRAGSTDPLGHADDMHWDNTSRKGDGTDEWAVANRVTVDGAPAPAFMGPGGVNANPERIFKPGTGPVEAIPFDGTGAQAGARLPGFVLQRASPNRDDIHATGKWSQGVWTVELTRALITTDPNDVQFPIP